MVTSSKQADSTIITLLPNRSASWAQTCVFLVLLCVPVLGLGLLWAMAGAWAVLPFSGLEALLLVFVMHRVCGATYQRQVITCSPAAVIVQFGSHYPQRSWILERERAGLAVDQANHPLGIPVLSIVDANHCIELGRFLNRDDKESAMSALKGAGLTVRSHGLYGSSSL